MHESDPKPPHPRVQPEERHLTVPGADLTYYLDPDPRRERETATAEAGAAHRMVFLHGFTRTGLDQWGPAQTAFVRTAVPGARLLIPDMRGHGKSRRRPRQEEPAGVPHPQIGCDLEAVIDQEGFSPAHFIGFSSGGIGMLYLALRRPQLFRSLTLISTSYVMTQEAAREVRRMRGSREESWYAEMVAELDGLHEDGQGAGHGERVLDMWVDYTRPPLDPDLALADLTGIEIPVLLIHGDRDRFFPVELAADMHRVLPDSRLCVLPDCGHFIRGPGLRRMMEAAITHFLGACIG